MIATQFYMEFKILCDGSKVLFIGHVIAFPAADGVFEPDNAIPLGQLLALESDQPFGGSPVTADFAQQVVEQLGLVDGGTEQFVGGVGLAGDLMEEPVHPGQDSATGRVCAVGAALPFAFVIRLVDVDPATGAACQLVIEICAAAGALDFIVSWWGINTRGHRCSL